MSIRTKQFEVKRVILFIIFMGMSVLADEVKFYSPSFSCLNIKDGTSEYRICTDKELSKLDRDLSIYYQQSQIVDPKIQTKELQWLKKRDKCRNNQCIKDEYISQIKVLKDTIRSFKINLQNAYLEAEKVYESKHDPYKAISYLDKAGIKSILKQSPPFMTRQLYTTYLKAYAIYYANTPQDSKHIGNLQFAKSILGALVNEYPKDQEIRTALYTSHLELFDESSQKVDDLFKKAHRYVGLDCNISEGEKRKIEIINTFYNLDQRERECNDVTALLQALNQYNILYNDVLVKKTAEQLYDEEYLGYARLYKRVEKSLEGINKKTVDKSESQQAAVLFALLLKINHVDTLSHINRQYLDNPLIQDILRKNDVSVTYDKTRCAGLVGHIGNRYFGDCSSEKMDFSKQQGVRVYSWRGNDNITGSPGIDEIVGGENNDTLNGNGGKDILEGGQNDDTLIGGSDQNIYRYAWGDGNDVIIDAGSDKNAPDALIISIDAKQITVERQGDDMVLHILNPLGEVLNLLNNPYGTIVIKDGYAKGKIELYGFKNGWYSFDQLIAKKK